MDAVQKPSSAIATTAGVKKRVEDGDVSIEEPPVREWTLEQKQMLEGPWELGMEIGENLTYPRGIAIGPDGEIAITDFFPRNVTFGSKGNLFVADLGQFVKVYDSSGMNIGKWASVSPEYKTSDLLESRISGLALDVDNQLFIGEVIQKYISKHNQDGTHVVSFWVDISPDCLAVTSQNTIIISDFEKSVQIVDNTGQLLHTIEQPFDVDGWVPGGVACFKDTVCVCERDTYSICCYSMSGEYLKCIPVDITRQPISLAFTADGKKLLVLNKILRARGSIKVYYQGDYKSKETDAIAKTAVEAAAEAETKADAEAK